MLRLTQDDLYRAALALRQPVLAEYEMTYRCNLRCLYCYQPNYLKHERRGELTAHEISAMLDDFAYSGVFFLIVTGGECTLTPTFRHVVSEARARTMDVSILTNGTALKPEIVAFLAAMRVSEVKVSIYGSSAEEYGRFTGRPSAWARVLDGLSTLKKSGVHVVVKVIVTSIQETTFRRTLDIMATLGLETEVSCHVMPAMDGDLFPHPISCIRRHTGIAAPRKADSHWRLSLLHCRHLKVPRQPRRSRHVLRTGAHAAWVDSNQ